MASFSRWGELESSCSPWIQASEEDEVLVLVLVLGKDPAPLYVTSGAAWAIATSHGVRSCQMSQRGHWASLRAMGLHQGLGSFEYFG